MCGRREVRRHAEPDSFIMHCKQSCLLYKHPWKNNPEQGAVSTSFTTIQKWNSRGVISQKQTKFKSGHPVAPKTDRTKSSLIDGRCQPVSASFFRLSASHHEPEITLSPSNSLCEFIYARLRLRGILRVVGLMFVYRCIGPAILTRYWTIFTTCNFFLSLNGTSL